ncbi:MAG: 4'-phosphopantetheinyl transferase superfamily protein [bacterium]
MTSINLEIIPPSFSLNSDFAYIPEVGDVVVLAADIRPATSPDLSGLSFDEQRRARSMGASEVRDRFVAGRHLLRQTLAPWLGMDPSAIELVVGEGGKPYVKQDPSLHFSISHSGEILLAAFSRTDIGVDLERQRDIETESLARRFFSAEEAQYLAGSPIKGKEMECFFRFWTCREAAIKADGRGMGELLGSTRVILRSESGVSESASSESLGVEIGNDLWKVIPWRLRGGYHAALALKQQATLIHWRDLR